MSRRGHKEPDINGMLDIGHGQFVRRNGHLEPVAFERSVRLTPPVVAGPAPPPRDATRIPIADQWALAFYIVAVQVEDHPSPAHAALIDRAPVSLAHSTDPNYPSQREIAQILSYQEFLVRLVYGVSYGDRILSMQLPADGGHNTTVFAKNRPRADGSDGGWRYRKATWNSGPPFWPPPFDASSPILTLEALIDKIEDLVPAKWLAWKAAHPEAFGKDAP